LLIKAWFIMICGGCLVLP